MQTFYNCVVNHYQHRIISVSHLLRYRKWGLEVFVDFNDRCIIASFSLTYCSCHTVEYLTSKKIVFLYSKQTTSVPGYEDTVSVIESTVCTSLHIHVT